MSQNNVHHESETFFTVNVHKDRQMAYFSMDLQMINQLLNLLSGFNEHSDLCFNKNNLLNFGSIDDFFSIEEVHIKYKQIIGDNLVINVPIDEKKLYIFCCERGAKVLKDRLTSLTFSLKRGIPEDTGCMIPEWGGDWLLNEQIIENSSVICFLRLFGDA